MWISSTVDVDLSDLQKFGRDIVAQVEDGQAGVIGDVFTLWAYRYRSYAQLRFDAFSKGGGDWQPLKDSTVAGRRSGTKRTKGNAYRNSLKPQTKSSSGRNKKVSILRDTGILFAALSPVFVGSPGAIQQRIKFGIKVGYGGPQKHIGFNGKQSLATIADIAGFHQEGYPPHLPKREIIVDPPDTLLKQMAADMQNALNKAVQ
jgi:hypothetical protein